jgi:hypothetical protein
MDTFQAREGFVTWFALFAKYQKDQIEKDEMDGQFNACERHYKYMQILCRKSSRDKTTWET